jgi:hypothetical protein
MTAAADVTTGFMVDNQPFARADMRENRVDFEIHITGIVNMIG